MKALERFEELQELLMGDGLNEKEYKEAQKEIRKLLVGQKVKSVSIYHDYIGLKLQNGIEIQGG